MHKLQKSKATLFRTCKTYAYNNQYIIQRFYESNKSNNVNECKVITHGNVVVQDIETKVVVLAVLFTPFEKLTKS